MLKRVSYILFLYIILLPAIVWGESTVLYENPEIRVALPGEWIATQVEREIASQSVLGEGRQKEEGYAEVTLVKPKIALGRDGLEEHLRNSAEALSSVPNIEVIQMRIFCDEPLIGMLDIERNDLSVEEYTGLSPRPIRQLSFIIPTETHLYQVFLYLRNTENIPWIIEKMRQDMDSFILLKQESMGLPNLQLGLMIGLFIALGGIVVLRIRAHGVQKKRRERESLPDILQVLEK